MRRTAMMMTVVLATVGASLALAQDPATLITKAEVEKAAGAPFKDGWSPMKGQVQFEQAGGDLQVSVDIDAREAGATVRTWAATMKKMEPSFTVVTVPGLGSDAVFYSTRPDLGKVTVDLEKPRRQLNVAVSGAKSVAQAKQIVVALATLAAGRASR